MAQVACVKVPASGWVKMEDLIKEQLDDDSFEFGLSTYQMQNTGINKCYFVEAATEPEPEHGPGFLIDVNSDLVIYVARSVPLWVKGFGGETWINISTVGEGE